MVWDFLKDTDRWPSDRPPHAPPIEDIPDEYEWPDRPIDVPASPRGYAVEASVMSRQQYIPDHTQKWDARDPDTGTDLIPEDDRVEIVHTLYRVRSGDRWRPGRLTITDKQVERADRLAWCILRRHTWEVVWEAEYHMNLLRDTIAEYCTEVPWPALREAVMPSENGWEAYVEQGYLNAFKVMDRYYD